MRPSFELSHETAAILQVIRTMSIGQQMSFDALSRAVGFKVKSTTGAYHGARRIALRDDKIVTDSIRGFGFVRLSGRETVAKSDKHLKAIRRRAGIANKEIGVAMRSNLEPGAMVEATRKQAVLGVILINAATPRSNAEIVDAAPVMPAPRATRGSVPT